MKNDSISVLRRSLLYVIAMLLLFGFSAAMAGQPDAWKADWDKTVEAAKKDGQIVLYGSADFETLYAEFHKKYPENQYLLNINGETRIVVGYNSKLVNPAEIKSYWDLLNPKWKGKIVAYDPTLGGSGDAMRFFYHSKSLGPEFIKRILTETDIVISTDTRQMGDWLAGGKFAFSIFGPVSRMDLDLMQTQGLPVGWFSPDQLKEGTYITGGSGGVAVINKAPHPNAAKVGLNWLLSREGQIAFQRLFTQGNDGPDSLRIDIPKDNVPRGNRRPEGDESRYPFVDRAEWMDQAPISKFVKEVLEQRRK